MNKYYLTRNYKGTKEAGNKAKIDVELALKTQGYKSIGGTRGESNSQIYSFLKTLYCVLAIPFTVSKGDVIVIQYPLKKFYILACRLAHLKGAKVITLVHDLGAFRRKKLTVEQENIRLGHSDLVIVHNPGMNKWLKDNHFRKPLVNLGLFDYLSDSQPMEKSFTSETYSVVYASNLTWKKNRFIYELDGVIKGWNICLYGNGFENEKLSFPEKYEHRGFILPDDLIATVNGDFGLVWDGESCKECAGAFGEYLKYNNPHKTSLYLRCRLPLIIWRKAALASFVEENNIGICVDSLEDLNEILPAITAEQYKEMRENTKAISEKLANGGFIIEAVEKAIEIL
ncbi:MAG: galactofuranosyltransferase [Tannerellaceae bacterium]|nr:galactofuranosyltransferase [Tannerellaceae bacterium]